MDRRTFLGSSVAGAVAPQLAFAASADRGLRDIAAARGLLFGTATAIYELNDADFAQACVREAAIIVPEYELKRDKIEPQRGRYDFSAVDRLLDFGRQHAMRLRGHPLVWHKANPPWLKDAIAAAPDEKVLTDYVTKVARHYRGAMHSWDVANEVLDPVHGDAKGYRKTLWLERFGPGFIDTAYHAAREADPAALLVYNDWGCEAGGVDNDKFRALTLRFLEGLLKRNVPIDALGLQGHLIAVSEPQVDQKKLGSFLSEVAAMGLRILVTELDVHDEGAPLDTARRDQIVADTTRRFLDPVLANKATIAVLTWGLSDRYLDAPGWRDKLRGYSPRMLPLDANMKRKAMWSAIATALQS